MAENIYSQIRAGLDWEKKGVICWGATPSDPLNLVPNPIDMDDWALAGEDWVRSVWADGRHTPLPFKLDNTVDTSGGPVYRWLFGTASSGTLPVEPDTTYTVVVDATTNGTVVGAGIREVGIVYYYDDGVTYGANTEWAMLNIDGPSPITFTTFSDTGFVAIYLFFREYAADDTEVTVNSVMLLEGDYSGSGGGSPTPAYNTGSQESLYDEITDYVMRATGEIGYAERSSLMPNDGSVSLTLNNEGRQFTPKHITAVYPGAYNSNYLDIGKTVVVLMKALDGENGRGGPDGWRRAFIGEITEVQVETGEYRDRTVAVTASQTIQAMSRHTGDIGIVPNRTLAEHIRTLFKSSGAYTIWTFPFIATDMDGFPLDAGVLYDEDSLFYAPHEGETTDNPGVVMDWPQNLADIIRYVIDYDGGLFFINEDGRTTFISYAMVELLPLAMVAEYSDFVEDEYVYDGDIYNLFQIDYTDRPMNVAPTYVKLGENTLRMDVGTDNDITIVYDFSDEEYDYANHIGQTLTITKVSDGSIIGSGVGISFVSELDTSGRTDNSGNTGWGTQVSFRLYNYTGFQVDVKVEVNGIACVPTGDELGEYRIDDSVLLYGQLSKKFDNPFITNDARRTTYGDRKREQLAFPRQYFKSLTTVVGPATYQYLGLDMGEVIKLDYEYQTDNTLMPLIVIGKSFDWEPQKLQFTFMLGPLEQFGALGPLGP